MNAIPGKQNEEGIVTYLVITVMVVLMIFVAGLLPMGENITRSAAFTRDIMQAQYIAEAGAKRAIAALANQSTDWSWLDNDIKVTDNSTNATYNVTISSLNSKTTTAPANGTYTIVSEGKIGSFMRKASVQISIGSAFPPKHTTFYIGNTITTGKNPVEYHSNGYIITHSPIEKKYKTKITFRGNAGANTSEYVNLNPDISVAGFEVNTIIQDGYLPLKIPDSNNQSVSLSAGKVYYANGVEITNNGEFKGPSSGFAIVCINGDFTISADSLNSNGNIMYLVNGNFTLNTGGANVSNAFLYCNKDVIVNKSGANLNIEMVIKNDLVLNASLKNTNEISTISGLEDYYNQKLGSATVAVSQWRGKE